MKVSLIVHQMWKHLTEANILLRRWLMLKLVEMDSPGRLLKLPLHQPIQISFSSGSVVPNMRLTKKLFYQGKQTRLLSTKLS